MFVYFGKVLPKFSTLPAIVYGVNALLLLRFFHKYDIQLASLLDTSRGSLLLFSADLHPCHDSSLILAKTFLDPFFVLV